MLKTLQAWTFIIGFMSFSHPSAGFAQDKKADDSNVVTVWVSEASTFNPEIWQEIGRFNTYKEASDRSLKWSNDNSNNNRLTREREIKVRIIPPGSGTKNPPNAEEIKGKNNPPQQAMPKKDMMEGIWGASCGSFYFSKGRFTHFCGDDMLQGRYEINGDQLKLSFDNGTVIAGSVKRGSFNGKMTNPKRGTSKDFSFTRK